MAPMPDTGARLWTSSCRSLASALIPGRNAWAPIFTTSWAALGAHCEGLFLTPGLCLMWIGRRHKKNFGRSPRTAAAMRPDIDVLCGAWAMLQDPRMLVAHLVANSPIMCRRRVPGGHGEERPLAPVEER